MSTEQNTDLGDDLFASPPEATVTEAEAVRIRQGDTKVHSKDVLPKKSIIRPVSGSRMLSRVANILDHRLEGKDEQGNDATESLGTYNKERFDGSRQNFRPEFDSILGQFDIRHPDGTLWTQDDATRCLKAFPLTYEEGHHKANEPILSCDIHNVADPYFNHRGLMRFAEEGELALNLGVKREELLMQMYAGNGDVAVDTGEEYYAGDTRYVISNPEAQEHRIEKKMADELDAIQEFMKMQDNRKRMLATLRLFGVDPEEDTSLNKLRLELYKYVNDNSTLDEGATYQQRFLTYAKLSDGELELREVIARGLATGEIRSRAGSYMYLDVNVGRMYSQVVDHFRKNLSDLDDLKERLKKK
jgi:hypothetical protein